MSEALQKVAGLERLALFPLPLVALPNEFLPLHIFEDRYRQMLIDVEQKRNIFGISFFDPDTSYVDKPATGTVGCAVEIRQAETLPDGRSNILTLGLVRYRLLDYVDNDAPYLEGEVEFFEDAGEDKAVIEPLADEVFGLFERMAKAAFKMGGSRGKLPEIQRADPESLSFLITAAFNFDNEKKYSLLEITSTTRRLEQLKSVLDQTVMQMEESAVIQTISRSNGHSKKKLDL